MTVKISNVRADGKVDVLFNGKVYTRALQWKVKRDRFGDVFTFPYVTINRMKFLIESNKETEQDVW
jgi:hypothetical protein